MFAIMLHDSTLHRECSWDSECCVCDCINAEREEGNKRAAARQRQRGAAVSDGLAKRFTVMPNGYVD